MLDNRNKTSHTYDEELAKVIYANIKKHLPVMKNALKKLESNYDL